MYLLLDKHVWAILREISLRNQDLEKDQEGEPPWEGAVPSFGISKVSLPMAQVFTAYTGIFDDPATINMGILFLLVSLVAMVIPCFEGG